MDGIGGASGASDDSNDVDEFIDDFQTKDDKEYRANAEKEKPKVIWNSERRCFLSHASNKA